MKKKAAYVHRIISEHDSKSSENLLLWRFNKVVEEGYALPIHDFNCYVALLIMQHGLENLPQGFKNSLMDDKNIKPEIQFELTRLKILAEVEEEIKEHYLLNIVEYKLGKIVKMKPYNRTERNPILFDDDKFVLEIDKNGFIMKFHQI